MAQRAKCRALAVALAATAAGKPIEEHDIDDESDRNPAERPFPYLPTMDPAVFLAENLVSWRRPVVVYRCVGKYDEESMERWLSEQDAADVLSVFVGASSSVKERALELSAAQKLRAEVNPALQLGGVAIPERHSRTGSEHHRMVAKQQLWNAHTPHPVLAVALSPARPYKAVSALASLSLHCARSTNMPRRLRVGASRSALQASQTASGCGRQTTKLASNRPLAEQ